MKIQARHAWYGWVSLVHVAAAALLAIGLRSVVTAPLPVTLEFVSWRADDPGDQVMVMSNGLAIVSLRVEEGELVRVYVPLRQSQKSVSLTKREDDWTMSIAFDGNSASWFDPTVIIEDRMVLDSNLDGLPDRLSESLGSRSQLYDVGPIDFIPNSVVRSLAGR